ncbi:nuclear transport factor 2 family protein [Aerosakkonema sp. BLCC-F183]|uniref:nuclear transport factor 2 family protein n=1 Tax=Aerosakkonema sp. BLCC-F183 TaxID=3342834 RepID=UPI0035BA2B28
MAEQENLRIVKQIVGEYTEGELPTPPEELLAENVEWIVSGSIDDPFVGHYHGREKVKEVFAKFSELTEVQSGYKIEDYITQGDKVIVKGHEQLRFKHSGRVVEGSFAYFVTLKDGKIVKFHAIYGSP